ncbi:MIP family channel protein [Ruminococcus sp.]|uniref:MIP/aquaporin family protein n=1 Tax=Ruminococcus sp. TaxID=41978 RepID=UPI0025E47DA0|nr:MIP family channel protein [Ruminococcus sp.]MBQ6251259.1 MIP family channel protein [Ruminococcus sp.]MBR0511698.1 MIP family channel protein [Ruminococcus sp.]
MESIKKYIAEVIGTFVLVLLGCGTAMLVGCDATSGGGYILTALAFGLVIVGMAYCIGNISGCHINPAVSLGVLLTGGMTFTDFVGYVVSQCVGAIAGAGMLKAIFDLGNITDMTGGYGSNGLAGVNGSSGAGILVEILLTFIFVMTILGVTSKKANHGSFGGLIIGLTLTLVHIFGIGLTGTSVNPARSLGPALLAGGDALSDLWVFIVGPFVGAVLAALIYKFLESSNKNVKPVAEKTAAAVKTAAPAKSASASKNNSSKKKKK